jgi:hypothetical protein
MFERYTEKARRVIFFSRYEASLYGQPYIESEHLLLGLLREDKALANRFLRSRASVESIRNQIDGNTKVREKISTSVDLPLSNECKRILAYAAEEAGQMASKHIGPEHLLLGMLREDKCFAAEILTERGVRLPEVRKELHGNPHEPSPRPASGIAARAGGSQGVPLSFVLATGEVLLRCESHFFVPLPHIGESVSIAGSDQHGRRYRVQDVNWEYAPPQPTLPEQIEEAHGGLRQLQPLREIVISLSPEA